MPKALVRHEGQLFVERAADTLRQAGCDRVLVVLGAAADEVRAAAPGLPETVVNPDWETGMASSLRTGLTTLTQAPSEQAPEEPTAVVVMLVDMPGVSAEAVRRIVAHATPGALVMGGYHGRRGHPVLLGRDHWAAISTTATGDRGARDYLRTQEVLVVDVGDVADDEDFDFPGNLSAAGDH
ncbi:nicotine blue oxidoreductase [Actinoplanes lutulentus]|uniref:Nicotine blue oxidoreductase n=2 Tax=Actinoplanes lutulentus TaxID=1287878 RepID=A0A327ZET7_9ACTN|nr:nicotine blue oxidoreductase [Actinoplanes lutulentus]